MGRDMVGYECRTREDHSSLRTWGKTVALETDNESGSEEGNNLAPKSNKANTIAVENVFKKSGCVQRAIRHNKLH